MRSASHTLRRFAGSASIAFAVVVSVPARGSLSFAQSCDPSTAAGLDTTQSVCNEPIYLGKAVGQTFFAPETVITAITAWRWAGQDTNFSIWNIHVLPVDSLGIPDVHHELRSGPTLEIPFGDGIHQTPFRFVFDPPVVLPKPGTYEFAIQGEYCEEAFDLAFSCSDKYPLGQLWEHGRNFECILAGYPTPLPTIFSSMSSFAARPHPRSPGPGAHQGFLQIAAQR
jgi:hypothetical protein